MLGKTPSKSRQAPVGGGAVPGSVGLTPSQKRRARKQKLEDQRKAGGEDSDDDDAPAAAAASSKTAASSSTPAVKSAAKPGKGKKLEETPAFVPAPRASGEEDAPSDDSDASATHNIITPSNSSYKKSISALSATAVLRRAEMLRRKEEQRQEGEESDDDQEEEDLLRQKKQSSSGKSALVSSSDDDSDGPAKKKPRRSSDDGEGGDSLTINQAYAKRFEDAQRKKTLSRKGSRGDTMATLLREAANTASDDGEDDEDELVGDVRAQLRARAARGGGDRDGSSGDSGSSEDEDGLLLTGEIESQIQTTLSKIKQKAPEVYESGRKFFTEEQMERAAKQAEATKRALGGGSKKSMGVKQLLAQQLLEEDESGDDGSEEDGAAMNSRARLQKLADRPHKLTYTEQQAAHKAALKKAAFGGSDEEGEEESDEDVFKVKTKAERMDVDEGDGSAPAAAGAASSSSSTSKSSFKPDGSGVTASNATEFLQSYLTGEWWKEKDLSKLPTYKDIKGEDLPEDVSASEDEDVLEKTDTFEAAYNFRFQEPGNAYQIKSYPRPAAIGDSLRKEESTRKHAREVAKASKEMEKLRKKEEITRLKAEKRKDLARKMKELEEIAGLKDTSHKVDLKDLLNNWDPAQHDALMSSLFSEEEFYADTAADAQMDEEELRELVLKGEDMAALGYGKLPDDKPGKKESGASKKKKKALLGDPEALAAFEATSKAIAKDVEELRDLDTQGLLGHKATFRWKAVEPNSFGLSMQEIFDLPDRELNAKVSLKKLAPYREEGDQADHPMPHKRKRDEKLARVQSKMAKRDAWKKAHSGAGAATPATTTPAASQKKTAAPKPAAATAPTTPAGPLSASQKRRQRKKKLEDLTGAKGGDEAAAE